MGRMKMPFGMHKGTSLSDLPEDYLHWLWSTVDLKEPLLSGVADEIDRRSGFGKRTTSTGPPPLAHQIVERGYRACAKDYHPDHGGTHDLMLQLNSARDWLLAHTTKVLT
jgi:hypothetical protein